jgi:hypothetical protein
LSAAVTVFGIRHHGPGSAHSLLKALETLTPDAVLIEGPPEAESILPIAAHPEMEPPVALLVYVPEEPQRAVFYPFAVFSPEWQAIRYGLGRGLLLRFIDLPQRHWLAMREVEAGEAKSALQLEDPLTTLAHAAGLEDGERWWEQLVEERIADADVFTAILEAMVTLREGDGTQPAAGLIRDNPLESVREAAMRTAIRAAQGQGFQRIAVVCGAWHAPALVDLPLAKSDRELLKGLPKVNVNVTWVPWSYGHLSRFSGYGAGITSPGWYEHLWTTPEQTTARWLGRVAHLLREEDLDASAAQVIDALRLAEALAALRNRPRPGLTEMNEAALSVLCFGSDLSLQVIERRLIVGERLGQVPSDAPAVPLQVDLAIAQKRLRLPPQADPKTYDLDLRQPTGLARSVLLHRLTLLGIPWGRLLRSGGGRSTFHEVWTLKWDPAFAVVLIEAAVWGNILAEAATALACHQAEAAPDLATLTALLDQVLLADLPQAVGPLMTRLQAQTALTGDVAGLMDALPPLARALRYGTVRQSAGTAALDTAAISAIVDGLVARICIGLPLACASLDDDAARAMLERLEAVQSSLGIIQHAELRAEWQETLVRLADQRGLHGLLAGRCCRLLSDAGVLPPEELARRLRLTLSPAGNPAQAAAWLEGVLRGSGLLLLHDEILWTILDEWVTSLPEATFTNILPVLRRTFAAFSAPERRQMGERLARGQSRSRATVGAKVAEVDEERANAILPLLAELLGLRSEEGVRDEG